ncbi:MAG: peptide chain release factor aRF-1, partial [Thermoplasmata archaeon]|nr:peptide chain release factor aRF-1 [Thermoplasmata archaeon]
QSQRRFERLIEIAAHEFFKKVGDVTNDTFLADEDLKGILIGGPGATKEFFAEKNYLHHELKRKVIDLFDTGYTDEYGLRELVENASGALSDLDLIREKKLIQKLMNEIRKADGGLSIYGEQAVLDAVKEGIIDTLLVSDGLRKYKSKYICPSCGFSIDEIAPNIEKDDKNCPKCQSEMELKESKDIIETLSKLADEVGTKFELISSDSVEGDMLLKAFSGLAGILRFKVAT